MAKTLTVLAFLLAFTGEPPRKDAEDAQTFRARVVDKTFEVLNDKGDAWYEDDANFPANVKEWYEAACEDNNRSRPFSPMSGEPAEASAESADAAPKGKGKKNKVKDAKEPKAVKSGKGEKAGKVKDAKTPKGDKGSKVKEPKAAKSKGEKSAKSKPATEDGEAPAERGRKMADETKGSVADLRRALLERWLKGDDTGFKKTYDEFISKKWPGTSRNVAVVCFWQSRSTLLILREMGELKSLKPLAK